MTTPHVPDDGDSAPDFTAARVRRHLEASTDHIDVVATPIPRVKDRAGQRTARRQRAATVGVIAAALVGVVGGIAVLSQTEPTRVITSSEPGGSIDAEADTVQVPSTELPGTDPLAVTPATDVPVSWSPVATVPYSPGAQADVFGDLGSAQAADPSFVWKVVDPGKEALISSAFGSGFNTSFPAFALSTAPGRSNDYDTIQTFLYRSEDGINWTQTTAQAPFATGYWNALISADQVFVTGTAPGIAATQPNPLQIAVGTGDDWNIAELPIDTNADSDLPMVEVNGPQVGSVPYGDGVLVVVSEFAYPDHGAISAALGVDPNGLGIIDQQPDGVAWVTGECLDGQNGGYDPVAELFGTEDGINPLPSTSVLGSREDGDDFYGCPVTKMSWTELGLPQESIDALSTPMSRFFIVSAELDITEIDGPGAGSFSPIGVGEPVVELAGSCCSDTAPPRFELVDGAWVESSSTVGTLLTRQGVELAELGDTRVGLFGTQPDGRVPFMSVAEDGTQSGVDLQPLLVSGAPASSSWAEHSTASGTHWVGTVQTYDDPIALQGGLEVIFGEVIVRQESQNSRFVLVDAGSGEEIDLTLVSGDANGNIQVRNEDGEIRAQFHLEDVYSSMPPEAEQQRPPTHSIVTTADGTSFSVESVAALLGLTDDEISQVARVSSDGTTVIVTVRLNERYADDIRQQLVLVGTPIS